MELTRKQFNSLFDSATKKWSRYIHVVVSKYARQEAGDYDDLVLEAQLIISNLITEGFEIESDDFSRLFKVKLTSKMIDYTRKCHTQKYDSNKTVNLFSVDGFDSNSSMHSEFSLTHNHDTGHSNFEGEDSVNSFLSNLSPFEQSVINELMNPSDKTIEQYENYRNDPARKKVASTIPLGIIATVLGVTEKNIRKVINTAAWKYVELTGNTSLISQIKKI